MNDRGRGFPLLGLVGVFLFSTLAGFAITECGESDAQPVSLLGGDETPVAIAMTGERISVTGLLTASEPEVEEGYFAIGQELTLVSKPEQPLHAWLRERRGQRVVLSVEVEPER